MILPFLMQPIVSSKRCRKVAAVTACGFLFAGIAIGVLHSVTGEYLTNRRLLSEVEANHLVEVQHLLAQGADPNISYWDTYGSYSDYIRSRTKAKFIHASDALIGAARNGNLPMVKVLLQYGAQVNLGYGCGHSELDYAEEKGLTEMVSLLTQRGSKKNRVYICE